MKACIAAFALIALLLLPSRPAAADDSGPCMAAAASLDAFLLAQPRTCTTDDDCDGFYYRADSCAAPVVLPKGNDTPDFLKELEARQNTVRQACAADWSSRGPCSPTPFKAACNDGLCVDTLGK
ncbi:MAG: hypothetical protein PW788_00585 [Micavibrio sp.]|nr:hypothetical protein [Micavibrio sp.]